MRAERALACGKPLHDRGDRITDVLLARIVSGRTWRSISPKSFCFSGKSSETPRPRSRPAHRLGEVRARPHARDRALVFAEVAQIGGDARLRGAELAATASVMVTSWPASAKTCAMPWPMRPAPTTAMRALAMLNPPCSRRRHRDVSV